MNTIFVCIIMICLFCSITVNTIQTEDKVLQKIRNMLKIVSKLFPKHNIPYWIDGGTLLGAVRHQDIIPWDDDADIVILDDAKHTSENKLLSLKSSLQTFGLGLTSFWGGYKIYPLDGESINYNNRNWQWNDNSKDIEAIETFNYKFPFIDICFVEKYIDPQKGSIYRYSSPYVRRVWPKSYFKQSNVIPLKQYLFGTKNNSFYLFGPSRPKPYLDRAYGNNWEIMAYKDYDHKNQFRFEKKVFSL